MNVNSFYLSKFIRIFFLTLISTTFCYPQQKELKIGLCVMATGKYACFLEKLLASADRYFLPNYKKTYFVFTDGEVPKCDHLVRIEQKRLGWPFDTMMRFKVYLNSAECFADCDYIYAIDADMLVVGEVGDEIIGERVGTRAPGYYFFPQQPHDDYEKNPISNACIPHGQGMYYFQGAFYGGTRKEFLKIITKCAEQVDKDLEEHKFIAKWHDESHLNRYFFDNPPTVVLCPAYYFPEDWPWLPFSPKMIALLKDHSAFRT